MTRSLLTGCKLHGRRQLTVSVCTGALLLGAAGCLRGRRATTHPNAHKEREPYYGTVMQDRVVEEGEGITASGVSAAIDAGAAHRAEARTHIAIIADKALDADKRKIQPLPQAGKVIVILPKSNRTPPREYDHDLYSARHLIENFFARRKQFRAIATRYDNHATNFLGAIYLAVSPPGVIDDTP